jgi:hypothetical protein
MKKRFRITYTDPETGESKVHVGDYEDTPGHGVMADGTTFNAGTITARQWAEDHAYALADQGPYRVEVA